MFKKILSILAVSVFCIGLSVRTYAVVRSGQDGDTCVFEYCDAEEISRTVDALWDVYDKLNNIGLGAMMPFTPRTACDFIANTLHAHGVGKSITDGGIIDCCVIAAAIFQRCDVLTKEKPLGDYDPGDYSAMHWYRHMFFGKIVAEGVYAFIEEFKEAGYSKGDNNYVALVFEGDKYPGTEDPVEIQLMGTVHIADSRGWLSHHFGQLVRLLAHIFVP